jgi:hypothetical protein
MASNMFHEREDRLSFAQYRHRISHQQAGNTLPEDFQLIRIVNCRCKLFFNHAATYLGARGLGLFTALYRVRSARPCIGSRSCSPDRGAAAADTRHPAPQMRLPQRFSAPTYQTE